MELARPGLQFLSNEQYNQLFIMHGTIMVLLYATPTVFGFANYILPLQIGSLDVAFPRLNAFSYTPLSDAVHSPGARAAGFRACTTRTCPSGCGKRRMWAASVRRRPNW